MLVNRYSGQVFVDAKPAPTTSDWKQSFGGRSFETTKQYFDVKIKGGVTPIGAPSPISYFDVEAYNADKAWFDANIEVNDGQSYSYLMNQVSNNVYRIWWIKVRWRFTSISDPQLQQPLVTQYIDANGQSQSDSLLDINDIDIYQKRLDLINIDLRNNPILLDGKHFIQYNLVQDTGSLGIHTIFFYEDLKKSDWIEEKNEIDRLLTEF